MDKETKFNQIKTRCVTNIQKTMQKNIIIKMGIKFSVYKIYGK